MPPIVWPKRAVVTAGMPYGNKALHFGHVGGVFVPADCYARFLRDRIGKENVVFVSGTDCFGSPIEEDTARKLKQVLLKARLKITFAVTMMPRKLLLMRMILVLMYTREAGLVTAEKFIVLLRTSLCKGSTKKVIYI